MGLEDRENKRKNVVADIIGVNSSPQTPITKTPEPQKSKTPEKTEEPLVRRTFYLRPEHVKAMAYEKADTNKDLSEIIRESLDLYFEKNKKQ